jgi:hypothetical protein
MGSGETAKHRLTVWTGIVGFFLVSAYSVTGAFQILVWNPLAAVPGATLREIHAQMETTNESLAAPLVMTWAVIGPVLSAAVLIVALRGQLSSKQTMTFSLLLLVLAAPSHWCVSFPAGMGIADAFLTTGGDHAPWGIVLYFLSALALAALVVRLFVPGKVRGEGRQ